MSLRDPLTGLPTLELLQDRLAWTMAQHQRVSKKAVLLLLESRTPIENEFRNVISHRLENTVRSSDTVAMLNACTFAVLLTDLNDSDNAVRVADMLIQRCQDPYLTHGETLRYRPSIGLSVYPDDANTVDEWMQKANAALDIAKSESNGVYKFYTEDMNVRASRRRVLAINLKKAWARDEIKIYGQPIFERKTNRCVSVELLLHWEHPDEGVLPAHHFGDIAQTTGLWVTACERLVDAAMMGAIAKPNLRWTWNMPSNPDSRPTGELLPISALSTFPGNMESLGMEISEDVLSHRPEVARVWMQRWVDAGGFIVIDNFGTNSTTPANWISESIQEVKTPLGYELPFLHCLPAAYGWRCVQKNIDTPFQWDVLPMPMLGQGNALHHAVPIEQLLHTQTIEINRNVKGLNHG